ncbi:hypothetical protein JOF56_007184 [Kibdelosporangium banguiense]|uniref:Uncharacterized protein n=1 Tax=Kibdelosporangium banguiense TaxID=1365924 RepID=A0ABS4TS29_9PSEU|nr:hypothetical protein [Kibdelosporangium banguiense]MBP2326799.1 hypothetical protein [Kibdelosporangium banguiense]
MGNKFKAAAVAAFALAAVASGTATASAAPSPVPASISAGQAVASVPPGCQFLSIRRAAPALAIANCNFLDPGFELYAAIVHCADGRQYDGNWARPHQISTARCPAGVNMTDNGPWILQI